MKASKFSEAQKAFILKQGSDGMPVADICRKAEWEQIMRLAQERRWSNMRSAELVGVAQTIACCGEVSRVSGRGQVAQRGVRPGLIIRNHPSCDGGAGVIEIIEERLVEKFVAHAAIECLADAVLHGLARRDEVPGYSILLRPGQHGVRGELGSVIGDDNAWSAAPPYQAGQLSRYTVT